MRVRMLSLIGALAVMLILLAPGTGGSWSDWRLYVIRQIACDGIPLAPLIADTNGVSYGTSETGGGCASDPNGCGTVFELEPIAGAELSRTGEYSRISDIRLQADENGLARSDRHRYRVAKLELCFVAPVSS